MFLAFQGRRLMGHRSAECVVRKKVYFIENYKHKFDKTRSKRFKKKVPETHPIKLVSQAVNAFEIKREFSGIDFGILNLHKISNNIGVVHTKIY